MYFRRKSDISWIKRFFRIALGHESLNNYFLVNFSLMQHHKYSLSELENMLPWERDIYTNLLVQHLKDENEKMKQRQNRR